METKYYSVQWIKDDGSASVDTFTQEELIKFNERNIAKEYRYILEVPNKHIPFDFVIKKIPIIDRKFPEELIQTA